MNKRRGPALLRWERPRLWNGEPLRVRRNALNCGSQLPPYCWPLALSDQKNGSRRGFGFWWTLARCAETLRVPRSIRGPERWRLLGKCGAPNLRDARCRPGQAAMKSRCSDQKRSLEALASGLFPAPRRVESAECRAGDRCRAGGISEDFAGAAKNRLAGLHLLGSAARALRL